MKIKVFICELCRRETMMKDESLMTGEVHTLLLQELFAN